MWVHGASSKFGSSTPAVARLPCPCAAIMRGAALSFALVALPCRHARAAYNEFCFGSSEHVAEQCCGERGGGGCWQAEFSEELCCHPMPPRAAQSVGEIAGRIRAKTVAIAGYLAATSAIPEGPSWVRDGALTVQQSRHSLAQQVGFGYVWVAGSG